MTKKVSAADIAAQYRKTQGEGVSPESVIRRIELLERRKQEKVARVNRGMENIGKFTISADDLLQKYRIAKYGGYEGTLGKGGMREFIKNPESAQTYIEAGVAKIKENTDAWNEYRKKNTFRNMVELPEVGSLFDGSFRENITSFLQSKFGTGAE